MTASPRNSCRAAAAWLTWLGLAVALVLAAVAGCSNNTPKCSAPSSGNFTMPLTFTQTIDVALDCDGSTGTVACGNETHVLDGLTLNLSVDGGSTATITSDAGIAWSCQATTPQSPPDEQSDGGTAPATGCYLLVTCAEENVDDAGAVQVQIQIPATGNPILVVVRDLGGACCADEYTGPTQ